MDETTTLQGRKITKDDIESVRRIIEADPSRNRTWLSQELCLLWNWRAANGQIKDMACRSLLLKLELRGHITLPRRRSPGRGCRKLSIPCVPRNTASIACALSALAPAPVQLVEACPERSRRDVGLLELFQGLLSRHHYLGFSSTVGANMKYLVFDREHNPLACLLFGNRLVFPKT